MRHRSRTALLHRQAGLCAIKGLDLAFLVNTKHQGVFRRVEVKTDNIFQLLSAAPRIIRARSAWRCSVRPERTILSSSALSSAVIASAALLAHMPHSIADPR